MAVIVEFGRDMWDLSIDRIRRADPLLMGAAIAYNSLFALVPLAFAFASLLTTFDFTQDLLDELTEAIEEALAPDTAAYLNDVLDQSVFWVSNQSGVVLIVSILIALWSGSRAVYAVQKALRTVQGLEDERGYLRSRSLGILVTVAAGIGVMIAYAVILLGTRFWDEVSLRFGVQTAEIAQWFVAAVGIIFMWLLLWAIYRWGPPKPIERSGIVAAAVAVLIVIGSSIANELLPSFSSSATAVFGTIGIFLVWLYYIGIVVVAAPTLLSAFVGALSNQLRR